MEPNASANALNAIFGTGLATKMVASRSPFSSPSESRAKKVRTSPSTESTTSFDKPDTTKPSPANNRNVAEPRSLFSIGANDRDYLTAVASGAAGNLSVCYRCKQPADKCGGVDVCVLKSNGFAATKCGMPVYTSSTTALPLSSRGTAALLHMPLALAHSPATSASSSPLHRLGPGFGPGAAK